MSCNWLYVAQRGKDGRNRVGGNLKSRSIGDNEVSGLCVVVYLASFVANCT